MSTYQSELPEEDQLEIFEGYVLYDREPPCACNRCSHQYIVHTIHPPCANADQTYRYKYTPEKALTIIEKLMKQINADRQYLREQQHDKGYAISKRWQDPLNRRDYVVTAKLQVPHSKDSRASALKWSKKTKKKLNRLYWLALDMDRESLRTNPKIFLSLLESRINNSPEDLATQDTRALDSAWGNGLIDVDYSETCVCMRSIDGEIYGQLQMWEDALGHGGVRVGFPRGILTLEAQAHILQSLRRLVETISADINKKASTDSTVQQDEYLYDIQTIHVVSSSKAVAAMPAGDKRSSNYRRKLELILNIKIDYKYQS